MIGPLEFHRQKSDKSARIKYLFKVFCKIDL